MRDIKTGQKDRVVLSSENLETEDPEPEQAGGMDIEMEYMDGQPLRRHDSLTQSYFDAGSYPDFSLSRGISQIYGGLGGSGSLELAPEKVNEDYSFFNNGLMDLEQIPPSGEFSSAMDDGCYRHLTLNKTGSLVWEEREAPPQQPVQAFEQAASPANHPSSHLYSTRDREPPSFAPFGKMHPVDIEIFSHDGRPGGRLPEDLNPTPCNCSKSQCLKLYCQCFAKGIPCSKKCQCVECNNTLENQDFVKQRRIQKLARKQEHSEKSEIFCSCKMSFCEKSYCVCNKHGQGCNEMCKCFNCKNRQGKKRS